MKVTDRRMFTDDGELREEYRFLEQQKGAKRAERPTPAAPDPAPREASGVDEGEPSPGGPGAGPAEASAGPSPAAGPGPGFMDLVAMLAEPIAFLLGDAQLPDGQSAEDLPRARMHIDLLAVLQEKTRGNVSAQETAVLDDLLAQLRMRYVEKTRS